jgi:hypothetical protein
MIKMTDINKTMHVANVRFMPNFSNLSAKGLSKYPMTIPKTKGNKTERNVYTNIQKMLKIMSQNIQLFEFFLLCIVMICP